MKTEKINFKKIAGDKYIGITNKFNHEKINKYLTLDLYSINSNTLKNEMLIIHRDDIIFNDNESQIDFNINHTISIKNLKGQIEKIKIINLNLPREF